MNKIPYNYGYGVKSTANGFLPSDLANLAAWYRFNIGITIVLAGVDTWADQSGNGRDLLQATDTNRPAESAGVITFDGVDNYLKTNSFTLEQPETVYLLGKQITHPSSGLPRIWDGGTLTSGAMVQIGSSPSITAGAPNTLPTISDWAIDTFAVVVVVYDGVSSLIQVNEETPSTGNTGTRDMNGFTLGAHANAGAFSNIAVKEAILYSEAHDAATRIQVIDYLNSL